MNCRPGDMAIIVDDDDDALANIGLIVRVLDGEFCSIGEWRCVCEYGSVIGVSEVDGTLGGALPGEEVWIVDRYLRPLRDDPGQDVTLTWKVERKPVYIKAPEWVK